MKQIDTLIHTRWIIPVEPADVVLDNHSLAIDDGRIVAILPTEEAHQQYRGKTELTLDDQALIPGLVNTHTHAAMSLFRGLADDMPLMEWLNDHIWPAEGKWANGDFVHDGTRLAIAEMLRGGTTCFSDMYFFPDEVAHVASQSGMRAAVGLIMIDFPTAWASGPDEYLSKGLKVHDDYRHDPLISTTFAPHAPYTVSDEPLKKLQMYAEELDMPLHIHLHETAHEVSDAVKQSGKRPLERIEALGLLTPHLIAVHMTQLTDGEIEQLATAGAHVVHCPESNLKLASGFCPLHKLHQAGVNVALGTDGAASNNDLDMFGEMRTAALLAKAVGEDASAIPAATALQMATLNGARALGLDKEIGSLTVGKAADVVAIDLSELESQPLYHPISQIVYATNRDKVSHVWVNGRHLLKERALTTLDENHILEKTRQWRDKIAAGDQQQNND